LKKINISFAEKKNSQSCSGMPRESPKKCIKIEDKKNLKNNSKFWKEFIFQLRRKITWQSCSGMPRESPKNFLKIRVMPQYRNYSRIFSLWTELRRNGIYYSTHWNHTFMMYVWVATANLFQICSIWSVWIDFGILIF